MGNEIEEVKKAIENVEQQILNVERELKKPAAEVAYLRDEKKQLREKERQLREKELLLLKADTSAAQQDALDPFRRLLVEARVDARIPEVISRSKSGRQDSGGH